jgi:hypothetical protein
MRNLPNWRVFVAQTDFITAFGRLLRKGSLREAYAREPEKVADQLEIAVAHRAAFLALDPEDLEFQAEVLLRKRFDLVTRILPETCAQAGVQAWPWFNEFARDEWPAHTDTPVVDALKFCAHLISKCGSSPVDREFNRIRFVASKTVFAFHLLRRVCLHGRRRSCLQVLIRTPGRCWHEFLIFLSLGRLAGSEGPGGSAPSRESNIPRGDKNA